MATPNPFRPRFGRIPEIVVGPQAELTDYLRNLTQEDAKYQTTVLPATVGAGKTTFLLNVERTLASLPNWHFIRLNNGQGNLLFQLLHGLQKITGTPVSDLLKQVQGISIMGNSVSLRALEATGQIDNGDVLPPLLETLRQRGQSVLIAIDEIEISPDVQAFASMYQSLIGQDYPLALLMTGLPARVSEVQNDDTLTFLLRANRVQLAPLDDEAVRQSYQQAFEEGGRQIDYLVLDQLASQVKGYAYAFQTIGYYTWRFSQESMVIDDQLAAKVIDATKADLFRNAYEQMYRDSSPTDQRVLRAIARLNRDEPVATRALQEELGWQANQLSVYRARLLDAELIKAPQRGVVQFNLPLFAEFIAELEERGLQ